jgi:hypothetical protein
MERYLRHVGGRSVATRGSGSIPSLRAPESHHQTPTMCLGQLYLAIVEYWASSDHIQQTSMFPVICPAIAATSTHNKDEVIDQMFCQHNSSIGDEVTLAVQQYQRQIQI